MITQAHTGHLGNSGLQRHSVGEIYPWTIMIVGDNCQAFHCITGEKGPMHPFTNFGDSFKAAHALAEEDVRDFQQAAKAA